MCARQTVTGKSSMAIVRRAVRAELRNVRADPALAFDCLVAITEACTNALLHGRGHEESPHPSIDWDIDSARAVFRIEDFSSERWSRAMHPSRDTLDVLNGDLDERVGGFGLQLMRELMDDVAIDSGPTGTTVRLTKKFAKAAGVRS